MIRVLGTALRWGAVFAAVLLVVAGGLGWLVAEGRGLAAAIAATVLAAVYMGLTAATMLVVHRAGQGAPSIGLFFGAVAGVYLFKLIGFVAALWFLRTADWLDPTVFGVTAIIAVLGTLAIDVVVMIKRGAV
jgi:hypothetical protein